MMMAAAAAVDSRDNLDAEIAASPQRLREVGSTDSSGEADKWTPASKPDGLARLHRKARRAMFTPMKVAKGPVNALAVGDLRVTVGEFVGGGSFCKVEEWKTMREPHEQMPKPWRGATYFVPSDRQLRL